MLYDVISYDNQVLGQVDASNAVEAWVEADKKYKNILDIREALEIWRMDIMLTPKELDILSDDVIAEQFEQQTLPFLLKNVGVSYAEVGKWGDFLHIEARGYQPSQEELRDIISEAINKAGTEHWIAKSVYDNWRKRAERFVSKDEWSEEITKYHGIPITEIPAEIPLNWYKIVREEYRDNYPGYIVRVYSK